MVPCKGSEFTLSETKEYVFLETFSVFKAHVILSCFADSGRFLLECASKSCHLYGRSADRAENGRGLIIPGSLERNGE